MGGVHGTQKGGYSKIDLAIRVMGYGGMGGGVSKIPYQFNTMK